MLHSRKIKQKSTDYIFQVVPKLRDVFNFHHHLCWETYQAPTACQSTLTSEHDSRDVSQRTVRTLHSEKVSQKVAGGMKGHGLY